jgi:hypothetical protein
MGMDFFFVLVFSKFLGCAFVVAHYYVDTCNVPFIHYMFVT